MAKAPKPKQEKLERTIRWIVIGFFVYAFTHAFVKQEAAYVAPEHHAAPSPTKECNNSNASFPAMPFLPAVVPTIHVKDIIIGSGEPAQCGQTATIHYEYHTNKGDVIFTTDDLKAHEETIRIGNSGLLPGLEQGMIGMKKGGERTLIFPPPYAFGKISDITSVRDSALFSIPDSIDLKEAYIASNVKLIALSPELPHSVLPLRRIDTRYGAGPTVACGDRVSLDINIWKMDGTLIFSTAKQGSPISFTIGASEVPLGLEQAVIGMAVDSQRLAIVPAELAHPLDSQVKQVSSLAGLHWPEHEIVLVEMTRLSVVEKPTTSTEIK